MRFRPAPTLSARSPRAIGAVLIVFACAWGLEGLISGRHSPFDAGLLALAGAALIAYYGRPRSGGRSGLGGGRFRCRHCGERVARAALDACPACAEAAPTPRIDHAPCRGCGATLAVTAEACSDCGQRLPFLAPQRGRRAARLDRAARGFTLIEVLMTVALMAMVFAMVGGILLSVIKASEAISDKLRTEKAGHGVLATLRRDLTGVYAYGLGGPAFRGEDKTELGQAADSLHFVTASAVVEDGSGARPELVEVGYRLGPADGDKALVLYRRAGALEGDPLASSESYGEIYGRVHSFDLQYLDPETEEWKESWEASEAPPRAVKVTLELALDEGQQIAEEQGNVEIPKPLFEMVVGISTTGKLPEEEAAAEGEQPAPPGN